MLPHPLIVLSLEGYLSLVRGLPLPSAEQRRNFVDFVSTAHSWYKHLTVFFPGALFYFFIDRAAGCDWLVFRDGSHAIAERKKQGFHYSAIPTAEYRARFGFLSYSAAEGTTVLLSGEPLSFPRDKVVAIPGEDDGLCGLPQPILEAGRVELTGIVHPRFGELPWWGWGSESGSPAQLDQPLQDALRTIHWPSESGGRRTLERIFERVAYLRDGSETPPVDPDPILAELMASEGFRQRTEMLRTIDRVCALIDGARRSAPDRIR